MSRQLKLDGFYKSRVSRTMKFENDDYQVPVIVKQEMDNTPKKRLIKGIMKPSPFKTPIKKEQQDVINLISDDEDCPLDIKNETIENSSDSTVNYSPDTEQKSPSTPSSSRSSGKKYFSPIKKRSLTIKTHKQVKRNLSKVLSQSNESNESHDFEKACQGLDDKTIFLLKIIHQYLNDEALKHLLEESSQELLQKCMNLIKPGLHLICRLYWRKEGWYRVMKLRTIVTEKKQSIDDPGFQLMLNCLLQNGLLTTSAYKNDKKGVGFNDYFDMLNVNEVKEVCKEFKVKFSSKEAARQSLHNFSNSQKSIANYFGMKPTNNTERVLNSMRSRCGECYKLSDLTRKTLNELYILMYLGINRSILTEKKLELMLIYEKANRETYPIDENIRIDNASVVFRNRHEFQRYFVASTTYEQFLNTSNPLERRKMVESVYKLYLGISKEDMTSYKSLPIWLRRFTPAYLYVKILEDGIPELKKPPEKEKYCQMAVDVLNTLISQDAFRQHNKAEWFAEKALICDKLLNDPDKASEVLIEGFKLDIDDGDKDCLRVRARLMAGRGKDRPSAPLAADLAAHAQVGPLERDISANHVYRQPMESFGRGKIKFEVRRSDGIMVLDAEEYCKLHYIEQGKYTHGEHWEGSIITTLFALLFWDIIYAELRGVRGLFLSRYQQRPLDMFTEGFYVNRRCLIEDRLADIEQRSEDELIVYMKKTWDSRPECELSDIQRSKLCWESVEGVSRCLRGRALAALCRKLARDYRRWRSGFPDLTLWNPTTKQIMFVEVKTDSDKPSIKQLQWMSYLRANDIRTEFCYVGTNTTRCRARNGVDMNDE